jgi:hypothetical protein
MPGKSFLRIVSSCLLTLFAGAPLAAQDAATVRKGLDSWLKTLRQNKLDVGSRAEVGKSSIARKAKVLPKGMLGVLTAAREIELMLDAAVKAESEETVLGILSAAAVGQDDVVYKPQSMPDMVRRLGEAALGKLGSAASATLIENVAKNGPSGFDRGVAMGMRAAAIRELARPEDGARHRPIWRESLAAQDADVRAAAAAALARRGTADDFSALVTALAADSEGQSIAALAGALLTSIQRFGGAVPAEQRHAAATAASGALGKSVWRVDMVLADLLEGTRDLAAVEPLIGILERYITDPKAVRSGALSGVLRHRAQEALVALTGASFPIEEPQRWREWFDGNRGSLKIADKPASRSAGSTTTGFFGIPVRGSRVIFVIDLSLSMEASIKRIGGGTADGASEYTSRLEVAKDQVWNAIERMDENSSFDIVVFSQASRSWQGKLILASEANKKKARKFIDELALEPYTNLWAGIMNAFEFAPGSNAAANEFQLDELFVLSDGAPTIGEITDPHEIIELVTDANATKKVRINTVFLQGEGSNMDPDVKPGQMGPAELMEEIAKRNGGTFVKL